MSVGQFREASKPGENSGRALHRLVDGQPGCSYPARTYKGEKMVLVIVSDKTKGWTCSRNGCFK